MADTEVFRKPIWVKGRAHEIEGLQKPVPVLTCKGDIAAVSYEAAHRDHVQGCGVSRCVSVGEIFEPRNQTGALGDLVRYLAVCVLVFRDEIDPGARRSEVASRG